LANIQNVDKDKVDEWLEIMMEAYIGNIVLEDFVAFN